MSKSALFLQVDGRGEELAIHQITWKTQVVGAESCSRRGV